LKKGKDITKSKKKESPKRKMSFTKQIQKKRYSIGRKLSTMEEKICPKRKNR
jgi:hypothetical protein